uniref:Transcriptional regulator n=1 Tax=Heterorhabditis bacteriophora TaxID=37862 RepID=A0A1I7X5X1_HETBA
MEEITEAFGYTIGQDQNGYLYSSMEEELKNMKRDEVRRKVAMIDSELRKYILKLREIQTMRKQEMIDFMLKFKDLNL